MSEWLKVMLEEIARERADAEEANAEQRRRQDRRGVNLGPRARSDGGSITEPAADAAAEPKRR